MKKLALVVVTVILALFSVVPVFAGGPPAVFSIQDNWGNVATAAVGPFSGFTHADGGYATLTLQKWDEQSAWMSEITKLTPEPGNSVLFEGSATNYGKDGHLGDDILLTILQQDTADYIGWRLFLKPTNESTFTEITDWSKPIVLSGAGAQQGYNSWSLAITATNNVAPVPEPGSFVALGSGLIGIVGFSRKRRAQQ